MGFSVEEMNAIIDGEKKETDRLKRGVEAIVSALVNGNPITALKLAKTTMYGGSVLNPSDIEKLGKKRRSATH